ncbi:nitrogenase cofactor biosynthesis protein NifB [Desulfoluna spongiiphila]|uniref:nitrogenase cofactor biosynthesis protein NifB n=1 Tax=Desulfoluna spongiiphila TaxID=419481 RepID=UPI001250D6BC|nr:nitrogenase cofactor biosynthesis protein NifB [Desulfoluna spongiiphila]VVS91841.1 nitrogenase cofactor biosynthesis protein nifb [Desulfoluna spongiiphila]
MKPDKDINSVNHPCFNVNARKRFGRVHLPVAPRCNIQCRFCDRKFDCVNESRPGVTSGVLSPYQALVYLEHVFEAKKNISVVGIAGPGDPFANPSQTMETLRLVRQAYPEVILCLATNGLGIAPFIDDLVALDTGHVTVTVNAVDPAVGAEVYAWVRDGKRVIGSQAGAALLMERQLGAIKALKKAGIMVKVNAIMIPGINDHHIVEIAKTVAGLGVDIFNCLPFHENKGSAFAHIREPSTADVAAVRKKAGAHIRQMTHCARCRADAVGCLGDAQDTGLMEKLKACELMPEVPDSVWESPEESCRTTHSDRPFVAVASMEGLLVNQHLGEAVELRVFGKKKGKFVYLETRDTPGAGTGAERWRELAGRLADCSTLLVSGIGDAPRKAMTESGVDVHVIEGLIDEALAAVFDGRSLDGMVKRTPRRRGEACSGMGMGCG